MFYIIEGGTSPLLISVKELRLRGAAIDAATNLLLDKNGEIKLEVSSRGHLVVDLAKPPSTI